MVACKKAVAVHLTRDYPALGVGKKQLVAFIPGSRDVGLSTTNRFCFAARSKSTLLACSAANADALFPEARVGLCASFLNMQRFSKQYLVSVMLTDFTETF
jgi:hypothetical protein